MNPDDVKRKNQCPPGTVITLGHPANQILVVKGTAQDDLQAWRYVASGELLDYDDYHKAPWEIYSWPVTA